MCFLSVEFFNVFCEFNRNVSFVCCGKIVKNKFLFKFLPNNPEIFEENYVLFREIGFWWAVVFSNNEEMVSEANHFIDGLKN